MNVSRKSLGSDLAKVGAHVIQPAEYEDVPELTEADFARGEVRRGGRPRLESPQQQLTLRLDQDVIAAFRATGEGWQSLINQALRRAVEADELEMNGPGMK